MSKIMYAVLGVVAASSCITVGNVQKAETLGKGRFQFGLEPGAVAYTATNAGVTGGALPHVDLAARYGVSENVDLGARLGGSGIEFQGKFQFTRPEIGSGLVGSVAPTIGGIFVAAAGASIGIVNINLPVLLGYHFAGGSELVFGPRLHAVALLGSAPGGSGGGIVAGPGASLGFAWQISEGFALMPEVSFAVPVLGAASASGAGSAAGFGAGVVVSNFKLGFLFGGRKLPVDPNDIPPPPPPRMIEAPRPVPQADPYGPPPAPPTSNSQPMPPPPPMPAPGPVMVAPPPPSQPTVQPVPQSGQPVLVAPPPPRKP